MDEHEETDDDFLWGELLFPDADGGSRNHCGLPVRVTINPTRLSAAGRSGSTVDGAF